MLVRVVIGVLVGAALGAAIGSTRTCETGGCPLTANPRRGALYGGFLGLLFAVVVSPGAGRKAVAPEEFAKAMPIVTITSEEQFQNDVLDAPGQSVAYFSAIWCPPCKAFAPTLGEVADEYGETVTFRAIDVDRFTELSSRHQIQAMPTTVFFQNGKETQRFVGVVPAQRLRDALDAGESGGVPPAPDSEKGT